MLARLLVRSFPPRARTFRTTSLACTSSSAALLKPHLAPAMAPHEPLIDEGTVRKHFSSIKFADAPISEKSKMSIPHEYMSDVQEMTLELGLSGADLLVQAKTGTGKTLAFLLPAIEQLAKERIPHPRTVSILIMSPTRELAMQIEKEARTLIKTHHYGVQSLIGGDSIGRQRQMLERRRCDILVATPGRLLDLLESSDLAEKLRTIQTVVLDEADRLLDVGFKNTLNSIFEYLPNRDQHPRQCMLYSATLSQDVKKIASLYLAPDHKFVSTLAENEINTHEHVPQTYVTVPIGDTLKATLAVLRDDVTEHGNNSKSMVFCTTTWGTSATAKLLKGADDGKLPPIYEIHSRMTQDRRIAVAEKFRRAKGGILVTSDVTARGMDFPGVTLVLQVGLPFSSEQYIHRLGRTARAGRSGKGVIILTPYESGFLRTPDMRSLPIRQHPELQLASFARPELEKTLQIHAYGAWLGFNAQYSRQMFRRRQQMVDEANKYAQEVLGWADESGPPPLSPSTARNLGIHGMNGVNTGTYEFGWGGDARTVRRPSWREDSRSDEASGQARRPPHRDAHRSSWNGERRDGHKRPGFGSGRWSR